MTVAPNAEAEKKVTETPENKQEVAQTAPAEAKEEESQQQINWKKFRESKELERKRREEAERNAKAKADEAEALKAAMDALLNKPVTQSQEVEQSEEERIRKMVESSLAKEREKERQERAQREAAELPQKLNQSYGDFDRVCSAENLDYLEFHYPSIARAFKKQPDTFDKWSDIYQTIKQMIPNPDAKKETAKMEKNLSKPQSMSQPGITKTGDQIPPKVSEDRYKTNWARMQRTLKGLN